MTAKNMLPGFLIFNNFYTALLTYFLPENCMKCRINANNAKNIYIVCKHEYNKSVTILDMYERSSKMKKTLRKSFALLLTVCIVVSACVVSSAALYFSVGGT